MADIFVSYTSNDRDWAFWIGQELEKLGHVAHLHDWEVSGGGNIMAWMDERADKAERVLCVVSNRYLEQPYSALERHGAQWAAASKRPNFLLPVFVEPCEAPVLLAPLKRCDLHGLSEDDARARLDIFLKPAVKPAGPMRFPGERVGSGAPTPTASVAFPGNLRAISNIPISVPWHFLGREDDLQAIDRALNAGAGRAAITALHGLRGVGKTVLAAAYAERHSREYRATWWVRAETDSTMRADLVGLGVRLGWVATDAAEDQAVTAILDRLRSEGDRIMLIYDNAIGPRELVNFLPRGVGSRIIVTSNAPNWGGLAAPVEIEVWPEGVGADFLIARTGRTTEREAAVALSNALGGLPLAHEQASAYCERVGIPIAEYSTRFDHAPSVVMDSIKDASREYHDGLTVSKTFALAIDEAGWRHPAAEPLIVCAALLAPEPIPLYLFSEGREQFSAPFSINTGGHGLDEAVAALLAFALVDREPVPDEREPSKTTDCIRLHRLVRQVAASRLSSAARTETRRQLIEAMAAIYPKNVYHLPIEWPKARRLDAIALDLVDWKTTPVEGAEAAQAQILDGLAAYRVSVLAAYDDARPLLERALAIREKAFDPGHEAIASSLNKLGVLLNDRGDLAEARRCYERALAIYETTSGSHVRDATSTLNNLGTLLQEQGDLAGARSYFERALPICERAWGPEDLYTATTLHNLGYILRAQGDLKGARPFYERALAIREKALGPENPDTATSLNNLGALFVAEGDFARAWSHFERAHAIYEKALSPDHPDIALSLNNLGAVLRAQGDLAAARSYFERALALIERKLGRDHSRTQKVAASVAELLQALKFHDEARAVRQKFGLKDDK